MTVSMNYFAIHEWVRRHKGKPKECTDCGSVSNLQWANISKEYYRDLEDYKALCAKCHARFDRGENYTLPQELKDKLSAIHQKTHCPKGHKLDEGNTYTVLRKSNGRQNRMCIICRDLRRREYYMRVGK